MYWEELAKLMEGKVTANGTNTRMFWAIVKTKTKRCLFLSVDYNGKTKYIVNPTRNQVKQARTDAWALYHSDEGGTRVF